MSQKSGFLRQSLQGRTLKTWYLSLSKRQKQLFVHPNVTMCVERGANLLGDGTMRLGVKWKGLRHFPGEFKLAAGSTLELKGPTVIYTGLHLSVAKGAKLSIGSAYIANHLTLDCHLEIRMGDNVGISKGVTIRDSDNHPISGNYDFSKPIIFEDNVWVGMNATILKGVTLGEGSIVGACSVVTRDVPPHTMVAGVPAKVIKEDVWWEY